MPIMPTAILDRKDEHNGFNHKKVALKKVKAAFLLSYFPART